MAPNAIKHALVLYVGQVGEGSLCGLELTNEGKIILFVFSEVV